MKEYFVEEPVPVYDPDLIELLADRIRHKAIGTLIEEYEEGSKHWFSLSIEKPVESDFETDFYIPDFDTPKIRGFLEIGHVDERPYQPPVKLPLMIRYETTGAIFKELFRRFFRNWTAEKVNDDIWKFNHE